MRAPGIACLVRVAIAAAAVAVVPSVASAQCVEQTGLEITVDPAGAAAGWCVAGALTAGDEHNVHATLDAPGLWQVELEALPGQIGVVVLAAGDTGLWEGLLSGDGLAISPPLLLAGGDYRIALATAEGMMIYRLRLTPAAALPAPLPAGVADDFAGMLGATGAEVAIPWTVGPVEEDGLWTVTAQTLVGGYLNVTLRDAAGATVTWSNLANEAGVLVLPDVALQPGDYQLLVSGPPDGAPILLSAAMDVRPPGFAAEPDELPETAHPLRIGTPATGRLATGGAGNDNDFFVVEIAEGTPSRLYDLTATAPSGAELRLALTDDQRTVLFERSASRQVDLRGLALGPGRHFFRVSGSLPSDVAYALLVEEAGEAVAGAEIEPNDVAARATLLPASGPVTGTFDGTDRDYLLLGVAGEMQLWDIEATGTGLAAITLYDGADQVIATTNVNPGGRVARLSRILLPPGRNIVRVDGTGGSWLLRATPRGPPVPGEEIEPNDEQSRALPLRLGSARAGWLDRPNDGDMYAFNLAAPHHVRLTLAGPADFPVRAEIAWGDAANRIATMSSFGAPGEPQRVVWDGLLPPGDFILEVWAYDGVAREPYALTLEQMPFHDRPADIEPNNVAWQAAPLAAGQKAEGVIEGDLDWFALDPAIGPGPVEIRAEAVTDWIRVFVGRGDPAAPETVAETYLYTAGETLTAEFQADTWYFLRIDGTVGPYALAVGPVAAREAVPVTATLAMAADAVAAFEAVAQRVSGTLTVRNDGKEPLVLHPSGWIGDERWRFVDLPEAVAVPAGDAVALPVAVEVPADARDAAAIGLEIAFGEPGARAAIASATIAAVVGAPPVGAHPYRPLPAGMLGGLNVAWSALGGTVDDPAQAGLIDDVVDVTGVTLEADATIRVAGGAPVPVAGVVLELPPGGVPSDRLADFAVELSVDGTSFERVLEARLSPRAGEQVFAFGTPREALAVRLVPLSVQSGAPDRSPVLAEFRAIAAPDVVLDPAGFDIALPALGGHVVRHGGIPDVALTGEAAVWPSSYAIAVPADRAGPPEWVLGFLNGRAANVTAIVWHPRSDVLPEEQIRAVEVLASVAGPLGPFEPVGTFAVDPAAAQPLVLDEPVWARALLFRAVEPATGRVYLPERIEIREAPGPSILGAWGDFARDGPYEAQLAAEPAAVAALPPVSTDRAAPTTLPLGTLAQGQVRRGAVEHWYAIDLPEGTLSLHADFVAALTPEIALTLFGEDGREIELVPDPEHPGVMTAEVTPGRWLLRVVQPAASVVVAWDTSFSVAGFYPQIARMVRRLGNDLDPAREAINLLPFRGDESRFLMDAWSGDPGAIYAALHAYPLRDSSSDAETALLFAARQLAGRVGARAVVIATDASYSGVYRNEALWQALALGGVKVFALHLPVDYDPVRVRAQTNLMADWAGAAGGHVSRFASQGDSEAAFRRVAAWLARPAAYAFTLTADTTPPEPGTLIVELAAAGPDGAPDAAAAPVAMAIILDASGSMLQRLGDRRRIDIAKDVLRTLGADILPEGLPVALRVFGHDRPDSCEQELFLPLAPLDRSAFAAAVDRVQSVNLARTPIAASLRAAAGDLADAAGARVIVLITDGEETCGGDPLAEIAALRAEGFEVRLNIVGFAIDDPATRALFETWAEAGAGAYFDAGDQAALGAAIEEATALPFVVVDAAGVEVAAGVVGGDPVPLPPGSYRLRVGDGPEQAVVIREGEEQRVVAAVP